MLSDFLVYYHIIYFLLMVPIKLYKKSSYLVPIFQ
nr:MAG TPA: hypothetical protein [Bacteriophage sp.]